MIAACASMTALQVLPQRVTIPALCAPIDGPVAALALRLGVPTETLGTVLLCCAVLFVWRKGSAILHTVSVLLLSAVLALYALCRRMRRRLAAAARIRAALAAFGVAAFGGRLLWPLGGRWAIMQQPFSEPTVAAAVGAAAVALFLLLRRTAAAPPVAAAAASARHVGASAGEHSRHRLRGKRGLQAKLLPSAVAEVWQLHKDGLLLQAAELLAEIQVVVGAAGEVSYQP